jgi:four helix bundle protein
MIRDQRTLRILPDADRAVLDIYGLTMGMPATEQFGLRTRLRHAAVAVASLIVHASARPVSAGHRRCLLRAHAAVRECEYLLGLSARLQMVDVDRCQAVLCAYGGLARALVRLIDAARPSPGAGGGSLDAARFEGDEPPRLARGLTRP